MLPTATIKQLALDAGFDLAGVAPPSALKDLEFLPQWLAKGYGGEMKYLANPRREDPRLVLPSVKSIVCVGLIYNTPYPYSIQTAEFNKYGPDAQSATTVAGNSQPRVWISRYAWGRDYHKVMRRKLEQLRSSLERLTDGIETRVYVDTGPVMERAFARISGIGWMGKNTCIINEQKGSWFFLGVILTNLELELDVPAPDRCGSCTRCLDACPTGALAEPYMMDASRCIAYLNIELRGSIPEEFRASIGNNVFGCDICQDVCPWNGRPLQGDGTRSSRVNRQVSESSSSEDPLDIGRTQKRVATTTLPEFQPSTVQVQPIEPLSTLAKTVPETFSLFNPTLENLAAMTEEDFKRVFAHSPIKRAKYRGWLRNLCVVMGNSSDRRFIPWLESAANNSDVNVGEHAEWALRRLQDKP